MLKKVIQKLAAAAAAMLTALTLITVPFTEAAPPAVTACAADTGSAVGAAVAGAMEEAVNVIKKLGLQKQKNPNMQITDRAKDVTPNYKYGLARSKDYYNTLINQFKVETNPRYKPVRRTDRLSTWCNIFAADVMSACNAPLTHWVGPDGKPLTSAQAKKIKGAYECGVRSHLAWLKKYGVKKYGWKQVSAAEAQKRANAGYPTIVLNSTATHIAVVRPESNTVKFSRNNVVIAQAGLYNVNYGKALTYFGISQKAIDKQPSLLLYFTHD